MKNKLRIDKLTFYTVLGVTSLLASTAIAVYQTPKAIKAIEAKKEELQKEKLNVKETVAASWSYYIPVTIPLGVGIFLIAGANHRHRKKTIALGTMYGFSEAALNEYKKKVVEKIGNDKSREIDDEIAHDRIKNNPIKSNNVIFTNKGSVLCYDSISGRYFKSDADNIKRIINDLNKELLDSMCVSINDLYYMLDLPSLKPIGDDIGWHIDNGLINVYFSSQISDDGTPCLVIEFDTPPVYLK